MFSQAAEVLSGMQDLLLFSQSILQDLQVLTSILANSGTAQHSLLL